MKNDDGDVLTSFDTYQIKQSFLYVVIDIINIKIEQFELNIYLVPYKNQQYMIDNIGQIQYL